MPAPIQPEHLILASASPRRAELMREAKYAFEIVAPGIQEPAESCPRVAPASYAESLAWFKAAGVAERRRDKTILAADTIAFLDSKIIGKPADRDDARRILKRFAETTHQVITGVALLSAETGRRMLGHDVSTIRVRALSDQSIEAYLDTGEWRGKAGAYGIQDRGDAFVEKVEGSFTNVVGLPMELLRRMFREWTAGDDGNPNASSG